MRRRRRTRRTQAARGGGPRRRDAPEGRAAGVEEVLQERVLNVVDPDAAGADHGEARLHEEDEGRRVEEEERVEGGVRPDLPGVEGGGDARQAVQEGGGGGGAVAVAVAVAVAGGSEGGEARLVAAGRRHVGLRERSRGVRRLSCYER